MPPWSLCSHCLFRHSWSKSTAAVRLRTGAIHRQPAIQCSSQCMRWEHGTLVNCQKGLRTALPRSICPRRTMKETITIKCIDLADDMQAEAVSCATKVHVPPL